MGEQIKKLKKFFLCLTAILLGLCGLYSQKNFNTQKAYAQESVSLPSEVNDLNFYHNFGLDKESFDLLLTIKNTITDSSVSSFSVTFFSQDFLNYSPSTEQGQRMFDDLSSGKLCLIVGNNANYEALKTLSPLKSLNGFEYIDFANINTLILDYNNISLVKSSDLSSFVDLVNLQINNNNLTSISLSKDTKMGLEQIKLRNNKLSSIDLSDLKNDAKVDLFNNYIENIDNLILPDNLTYCDLSFNNITNLTNIAGLTSLIGCRPILLVQGLNRDLKIMSKISVFSDGYMSSLKAICSYRQYGENKSSFSGEILSTKSEQVVENIFLPAGKISLNFSYILASGVDLPSENLLFLQNVIPLNISLPSPKYTCKVKDNLVDSYEQKDNMSFDLSLSLDQNLPNFQSATDNAKIYCKINDEVEQKDSFVLTSDGEYTIELFVEFDGLKSQTVKINAKKTNPFSITLLFLLVFGLTTVTICAVFLFKWFKNGAVVAPLSDKEIYRLNRSKKMRESGDKYSYSYDKNEENGGVFRYNQNADDYLDLTGENTENLDNISTQATENANDEMYEANGEQIEMQDYTNEQDDFEYNQDKSEFE